MTPADQRVKNTILAVSKERKLDGHLVADILPTLYAEVMNRTGVRIATIHRVIKQTIKGPDWDAAARECGLEKEAGLV